MLQLQQRIAQSTQFCHAIIRRASIRWSPVQHSRFIIRTMTGYAQKFVFIKKNQYNHKTTRYFFFRDTIIMIIGTLFGSWYSYFTVFHKKRADALTRASARYQWYEDWGYDWYVVHDGRCTIDSACCATKAVKGSLFSKDKVLSEVLRYQRSPCSLALFSPTWHRDLFFRVSCVLTSPMLLFHSTHIKQYQTFARILSELPRHP